MEKLIEHIEEKEQRSKSPKFYQCPHNVLCNFPGGCGEYMSAGSPATEIVDTALLVLNLSFKMGPCHLLMILMVAPMTQ